MDDYTDPRVLVPRVGPIDTGDSVSVSTRHGKVERWLVAYVDGDDLAWCGWPPGFVRMSDLADLKRIREATDVERTRLLHELAAMSRDERGFTDVRCSYARRRLGFTAKEQVAAHARARIDALKVLLGDKMDSWNAREIMDAVPWIRVGFCVYEPWVELADREETEVALKELASVKNAEEKRLRIDGARTAGLGS